MKTCKAVGEVGSKMGVSLVEFGGSLKAVSYFAEKNRFWDDQKTPKSGNSIPKKMTANDSKMDPNGFRNS